MWGKVLNKTAWKGGMIREERGRSSAALDTETGDDRQRHCQCAPAEAGKVIDRGNFFLMIVYAAAGCAFVI